MRVKSHPRRSLLGAALHPETWVSREALAGEPEGSLKGALLRGWLLTSDAVEGFIRNNDLLRAAALTYTVALSIVPILALAFSVLKGFGYAGRLRPLIERYLALGSPATAEHLMRYVENVNATALGSVGAAFLLVTVISTMGTIEQAFNTIFRVPQSRSYARRFADYLSVLFTVPLFMVAALAITTLFSVRVGHVSVAGTLTPYLFAWTGFFFLFVFFPYTKVRYRAALLGSFVTAVLFQVAQWGYVYFQLGASRYRAIYGALASVPIFLVWIYVAWSIVLFGAELTAAAQRGAARFLIRPGSPVFPRAAALYLMMRLAEYQVYGGEPLNHLRLALELNAGLDSIEPIVKRLKDAELVAEEDAETRVAARRVFLTRAASAITLDRVLECAAPAEGDGVADPRIRRVLAIVDDSRHKALSKLTLGDLLAEQKAE